MPGAHAHVIASDRLDLVSLDSAFLKASLAGDCAAAEKMLGLPPPPQWFERAALMERRLAQLRRNPSLEPWLVRAMILRSDRVMVGHIGFHDGPGSADLQELAPGGVEFGYSVFPEHRRQGYAREAAHALMQWAHQEQNVTRFVVSIRPDNVPSRRIAEHFGFHKIGSHIDEIDGLEEIYELQHITGQCPCAW